MTDDRPAPPGDGGGAGDQPETSAPPVRRRRRHRRATGGTAPQADAEPRAPRAAEDTAAGWGGHDEGDDDQRILREVPPHW